jgi:hypothetical protein
MRAIELKGTIRRIFYNPAANEVKFMLDGDPTLHVLCVPPFRRDNTSIEMTQPGDMVTITMNPPDLSDAEVRSWTNGALDHATGKQNETAKR